MHSFYLDAPGAVGQVAALPKDEAKHAAKVLRLREGDAVCALDGAGGRFSAEVVRAQGEHVELRLTAELPPNEPPVRLTVYPGLPKSDKLEFMVQKLTELGAAACVPVVMARSVARPDARDGEKRRERLERIAREAAKQCRRARPAEVDAPLDWPRALERMAGHELLIVPWEGAGSLRMGELRAECPGAKDIAIAVGPEGGISEEEVAALRAHGRAWSRWGRGSCARRRRSWRPRRSQWRCGATCEGRSQRGNGKIGTTGGGARLCGACRPAEKRGSCGWRRR